MKKIRISKKQEASKAVATQSAPAVRPRTGRPPTTFFSLPAELRNQIYELHVESESLAVFQYTTQKTKPPPIPIRLVSHQAWTEYQPILLSTAPITFTITDLNFRPLISLLGGLRRAELIALRKNHNLTIKLILLKTQKSDINILHFRRWLVKRSEYMDRLVFEYGVHESLPSAHITRIMALTAYMHALADLKWTLHESLLFELEPVEDALKEEHAVLVEPGAYERYQRRIGAPAPRLVMNKLSVARKGEDRSRVVRWPFSWRL